VGWVVPTWMRTSVSGAEGARVAIDFSAGCACVSHAFDVLGMCVMVTSALPRVKTERGGFLGRLGIAWRHSSPSSSA
jgi:hypothetical protein